MGVDRASSMEHVWTGCLGTAGGVYTSAGPSSGLSSAHACSKSASRGVPFLYKAFKLRRYRTLPRQSILEIPALFVSGAGAPPFVHNLSYKINEA
jgi:hypothetical protein